MKATGIVRRIDDLGRVVIPKEIRRTMRIREGDPLEIYTDRDGEVILKKYSPIGELNEFAGYYADSASSILGCVVLVTDTDQVIAVSGGSKKDFLEKKISETVEDAITEKVSKTLQGAEGSVSVTADGIETDYHSQIIAPIVTQGDSIGSVIMLAKEQDKTLGKAELAAAEIGAGFLARQMES